jgi:hypothetical protein
MVNGGQNIWDWTGATATVSSSSDSASAIMSIGSSPVAGGTGYVVGDTITVSGGTGATATVNQVLNGSITGITVSTHVGNGGVSYAASDILNIVSQSGQGAQVMVTGVSSGTITTVSILNGGQGYQAMNGAISYSASGSGRDAWFDITSVANGVIGADANGHATTSSAGATVPLTLTAPGTGYSTGTQNTTGGTGTGATVNVISLAQNTITIQGTQTIGQLGFYNDNNGHNLLINGKTFSYLASPSNNNSLSFLGVSPDPTTASLTAGMTIFQAPQSTANTGASLGGLLLTTSTSFQNWTNDLIITANEQVLVGCLKNNSVYISQINSFTGFNGTNGNGGIPFIFGAPPVGFAVQEANVYVTCQSGQWYELVYTPSVESTLVAFGWTVYPLKTGINQTAQSQALMCNMPNDIAFVTNEPIIRTLGRVNLNLATPQMVNISSSIVNDVSTYNFTGGSIKYQNEYLYVAIPKLGIIRIYNMTAQDEGKKNFYWEAPQTIPLSGFMNAGDGNVYGHSALTSDTYLLFNGSSDNGAPISAMAVFPQITFGTRHKSKSFIKEYVEGYITQPTTLTCKLVFVDSNKTVTLTKNILGTNPAITNNSIEAASLGKVSLGKNPLGGDLIQTGQALAPNFATYLTFQRTPFFKVQPIFSSLGTSQDWQILAYGFNQQSTSEQEASITV